MVNKTKQLLCNLFSLCLLVGGSISGIGIGVLSDGLGGGTDGMVRIDMDGLPVDAERIEEPSSTMFRVS